MHRPTRWAAAALAAALTSALAAAGSATATVPEPPGSGASGTGPGSDAAAEGATVTLLTGDVVHIAEAAPGRFAGSVDPAPGRESITFHTVEADGRTLVLPADAARYVAEGVLDERLFDVELLVEQDYHDAASPELPLIVEHDDGETSGASLPQLTAASAVTSLPSTDAAALRAGKGQLGALWRTVTGSDVPGPAAATAADAELAGGIERIWLDGRVEVDLDRSVPQIGAPSAWDAGYDGSGVTVAVLDTGVDASHPDLAGQVRETRDFTGDGDATDGYGHGTHVAATVAGTGDASAGARSGVAPGADLLSGKVLNDFGFGQESWIIAGMEWAANAGADVINMSLGSGATDGTDPLSQAVNMLSDETGALFVISAGNDGRSYSVGAPGAADAALTVGAVDRDGELAEFSSRGPRALDNALKPEITAPGVGIVAARADDTGMGEPVSGDYTAASGTSMAAPHVAGAAALLTQRYPDWSGDQLKDALVSTADPHPDLHRYAQGGGRVDAARAVDQSVYGTGVVDFGMREDREREEPVSLTASYVNTGGVDVTLQLEGTLHNQDQGVPADDAVLLAESEVTVPAGGSATVPVALDVAALAHGRQTGEVTATGPDGTVVRTVVAVTVVGPKHEVTIRAVDDEGEPAGSPTVALHGADRRTDSFVWLPDGAERTLEVEEGTYMLQALIPDRTPAFEQYHLITNPELSITGDTELVLDARETEPVRIETPRPTEQRAILSYYVHREMPNGRSVGHGVMHFSTVRQINVTPTDPVEAGGYEFSSRWQLVAPRITADVAGVDGPLPVHPLHQSPLPAGKRQLPLVNATGDKWEELSPADVDGAAVLVQTGSSYPQDVLSAAAEAGAEAVFVIVPEGSSPWTVWRPLAPRDPVPGARMAHAAGQELRAHLDDAAGTVPLTLEITPASPYLYDVMHVEDGHVPDEIVHEVTRQNTAQFDVEYPDMGGFDWAKEQRFGWRPWQDYAWNDTQRFMPAGLEREEWVSSGDTMWHHRVHHEYTWDNIRPLAGGLTDWPASYDPGRHGTVRWHGPVVRPAVPQGGWDLASTRVADTLRLRVPELVDGSGRHVGNAFGSEAEAQLLRDGELVAELPDAMRDVPVPAEPGRYRLELDTERDHEEWQWATRTETAWEFDSARPDGDAPEPLRLLQVDYDVPADLDHRVRGNGLHQVGLELRHQDGLPEPRLDDITVEVSYDEGDTWREVPVRGPAHNLRAHVHPRGYDGDTVSLRVHATAQDGSEVTQTVIRAYGLR